MNLRAALSACDIKVRRVDDTMSACWRNWCWWWWWCAAIFFQSVAIRNSLRPLSRSPGNNYDMRSRRGIIQSIGRAPPSHFHIGKLPMFTNTIIAGGLWLMLPTAGACLIYRGRSPRPRKIVGTPLDPTFPSLFPSLPHVSLQRCVFTSGRTRALMSSGVPPFGSAMNRPKKRSSRTPYSINGNDMRRWGAGRWAKVCKNVARLVFLVAIVIALNLNSKLNFKLHFNSRFLFQNTNRTHMK